MKQKIATAVLCLVLVAAPSVAANRHEHPRMRARIEYLEQELRTHYQYQSFQDAQIQDLQERVTKLEEGE